MPPMQRVFDNAELSPTSVLAGDSRVFVLRLTVGPDYTDGPSRIFYDLPGTLGFSRPALLHQEESGFVEVFVSNPEVTYTKRNWDMELVDFASRDRSSWRGMAQRMFVLDLSPGLSAGDVIEMRWGDAGHGYGPGTKVTTVVPRPDFRATIHVRYFRSQDAGVPDLGRSFEGYDRPEPDCEIPLSFAVHPREVNHLRLLRKTDKAMLLPLDEFWNVCELSKAEEVAEAQGMVTRNDSGAFEYADKNIRVHARRLEMLETAPMDDVFEGRNLYWGDIHSHSAFSNDCIEREKMDMTPGDLMTFARQRAGLDFYAACDHHQPWDEPRNRISRSYWERTIEAVSLHDTPGEFLAFPGIEFRCRRGDTAVVFNWLPDYDEINQPDWTDIRAVWDALGDRDYLSIAHFHNTGGLDEGEWWYGGPRVEPVIEMFSCHGSYESAEAMEHGRPMAKSFRPDRNAAWLLAQGNRYGLVANSDGHKGHVGSSGVTAVFAESLEKDAILRAYRERHVYATTNARIRLLFTANGALMGSALKDTAEKSFAIDVVGEAPLKKVEVFRDGEVFRRLPAKGRSLRTEFAERDGGPSCWYVRATQLDNHVAWSSPIWFE
jgi:uncharacterized protein DUF3604